ncbi:MAG: hypothetical protein ACRDZ4_06720 [Egibacteraceae bacterium]
MIVDSLEKLRGTTENDEQVQASVEGLFVHHSDKLRFESHHTVYTVPPYLMFTDPGSLPYDGTVRPVPVPQVRDRKHNEVKKVIDEMTPRRQKADPVGGAARLLGSVEGNPARLRWASS